MNSINAEMKEHLQRAVHWKNKNNQDKENINLKKKKEKKKLT